MKSVKKWSFNPAITIALLALFLGVIQFLLNTPLLLNFYMEPKLVISGNGSDPKEDILLAIFEVANEGRSSATNVEIGLLARVDQMISIIPNIEADIKEDKEARFMKHVRILIPKLAPGERISIIADSTYELNYDPKEFFADTGESEIPEVTFIKSDQGKGIRITNIVDQNCE